MKHSMRAGIRAGVCVAMATTSVAVFAGDVDESSAAAAADEKMEATTGPSTAVEPMKYEEPAGGASGEPTGIDARSNDDRAKETASLQDHNQRRFLEDTWRALP